MELSINVREPQVTIAFDFALPALQFTFPIAFGNGFQPARIVHVEGFLVINSRKLAPFRLRPQVDEFSIPHGEGGYSDNTKFVDTYCLLTREQLLHLDAQRSLVGGDVYMRFEIFVTVNVKSSRGNVGAIETHNKEASTVIHQSNWIKNFYPHLMQERLLVMELSAVDYAGISEEFSDELDRIQDTLERVDGYIRDGHWRDAYYSSREIIETFKGTKPQDFEFRNQLKKRFYLLGYDEGHVTAFFDGLAKIYTLLSKPGHTRDQQQQQIVRAINPQREEAEFAYATAYTLTNMLLAKLRMNLLDDETS